MFRYRDWVFLRPDAEYVWRSEKVVKKLRWYYDVMVDRKPAKFIICRRVGFSDGGLEGYSLEELYSIHDSLSKEFRSLFNDVREGKLTFSELRRIEEPRTTYLDVKERIAREIIRSCRLCEWRCGVNRREGGVGVCRLGTDTYVSSYFLHVGEEAPLVPSGTIFYGSCNLRCVFCQNYDISQVRPFSGVKVDCRELALIQRYLREGGARNVNHVGGEPTPNLHTILGSLKYLDLNVPQLWNSNMYLSTEALSILLDVIDIWLPDFKYGNNACGLRLSKVKNYFDIVCRNHAMICSNGDPIIIRHLVMPNHIECCTKPVLEWIARNCSNALVNVMAQYRPEHLVLTHKDEYRDIARRPTAKEMEEAYEYARKLGIDFEEVS